MSELRPASEEQLYERLAVIVDEARSRVARTVNTAMVHAYWLIGREIVEVEQGGAERAGYGEGLMKAVAARLSAQFGKGFSLAGRERRSGVEPFEGAHGALPPAARLVALLRRLS